MLQQSQSVHLSTSMWEHLCKYLRTRLVFAWIRFHTTEELSVICECFNSVIVVCVISLPTGDRNRNQPTERSVWSTHIESYTESYTQEHNCCLFLAQTFYPSEAHEDSTNIIVDIIDLLPTKPWLESHKRIFSCILRLGQMIRRY